LFLIIVSILKVKIEKALLYLCINCLVRFVCDDSKSLLRLYDLNERRILNILDDLSYCKGSHNIIKNSFLNYKLILNIIAYYD
jgi:hypothetical protein